MDFHPSGWKSIVPTMEHHRTMSERPDWRDAVTAFAEAAQWYADSVALVGDRWDRPGLGEWDVRALVGHTSRALLTVEAYLSKPADSVDVPSAVAYYPATRALATGADVAARGREAGQALGPEPAYAVAEVVARVVPLVSTCTGDELVTTIAGGMRLADYLPTRTFELVVHTADLARALGTSTEPPPIAAAHALRLVAQLAAADGLAGPLLLAATGRDGLPPGFSVL